MSMAEHNSGLAVCAELFKPLLLRACGFSFEEGRERILEEALGRRMAARRTASARDYLELLDHDPGELRNLVELLTVNETYFLREPDHLRLITGQLVPELLAARQGDPVRILSAGCSTGEEPYSLAMLLRDVHGPASSRLFRLAGVDIDTNVIARARRGIYGKGSFRGMEPDFLARYFDPNLAGGYRVKANIREQVEFQTVNLLAGEFPLLMRRQDLILYRNVSIYFPESVRRKVFGRLAECLNEGGYLLVGATETLQHDVGLLTLLERDSLYVFHKTPGMKSGKRLFVGRSCPLPGVASAHVEPAGTRPKPYSGKGGLTTLGLAPKREPAALPKAAQRAALVSASLSVGLAALPIGTKASEGACAGRSAGARASFDEVLEKARGLASSRMDDALALVRTYLTSDPDNARAHCLEASLLLSAHKLVEAAQACRKSLARDPLSLDASLLLGVIAFQQEDNDEALKRFRAAIYKDASCWPAQFYLAEILFNQGQRKRAAAGYETVLKLLAEGGSPAESEGVLPLDFKAEQFLAICRHKLALIKNG